MKVTKKDLETVALLSRLSIPAEKEEQYTQQLSAILDYIDNLSTVNTDEIQPIAHVLPISNVFRDDVVKESLDRAKALGAGAVAITGNLDFYGKCGFVPGKSRGIRYAEDPEADYFLICELQPGFLDGITGIFRDPEGYFVDEAAAEAFDAAFPLREKLKLPGQLV